MICDLAQYYSIYDYGLLPVKTVATLVFGLGPESRIKQKLSGTKAPQDTMLLAGIVDRLEEIMYFYMGILTEKPQSIVSNLYEKIEEPSGIVTFEGGRDFEKAWLNTGGR